MNSFLPVVAADTVHDETDATFIDNEVKLAKERKEYGDDFLPSYEDYLNTLKRAHEQNLRFEIKWVRLFSKSTWSIKIKN